MAKISKINAREILDSRGNPTIETTVMLEDGSYGTASVPSGASVGSYEAVELRDKDLNRFQGMGVLKAIANIHDAIAPQLIGKEALQQQEIDSLMISVDGSVNKKNLGANSILSVSLAVCRACCRSKNLALYRYLNQLSQMYGLNVDKMQVPTPIFNVINGGKHGTGNLDFQEFQAIPASSKSFSQALQLGVEVYHSLKKMLSFRNATYSVGDEGGFTPNLFTNLDALEVMAESIAQTRYKIGIDVFLGLDLAANHFFKNSGYRIIDKPQVLKADDFIAYLDELNNQYRLIYLEDPLSEDDWVNWQKLTKKLSRTTVIVGDDLLVTNKDRLQRAISLGACSAVLVKPNQIGTLSETFEVIKQAKEAGFKVIISHRSGETNDSFIADLGIAVSCDYAKFGAPARGERVGKYNRLWQIEKEL